MQTGKFECGNGYTAEVNGTRVHVYLSGVWQAVTDHDGRVVRALSTYDRAAGGAAVAEGLRLAGARKPAPRPAALTASPALRARNWRCRNPRDCGDPSCDGSCGY